MTPGPPGGDDPYAAYSDAPPAPAQAPGDPYAAYDDAPPAPKPKGREIGPGEAVGRGAAESMSFGAFPAIHGIMAAGGLNEIDKSETNPHAELEALVKGLGKLGYEHLIAPALGINPAGTKGLVTGDKSGPATQAYNKTREEMLAEQQSASDQNPGSFIAGQVGGAVATPAMGAIKGATALGRAGYAALSGAKSGALYGAGTGLSEGEGALDIGKSALKGGTLGAVLGGAGSGLIEGAGKVASRVRTLVRGARDPEAEAARGIIGTMKEDMAAGGGLGIDREADQAARRAGMPVSLMDMGGQGTRELGRAASNLSPRALGALESFTKERLEGRPQRIAGTINRLFGGGLDSKLDQEAIKARARAVNRPRYAAAYAAGDRPIWSPELERLSGSDAVQAALKKAVSTGKDRAIADKFGGFRPGVQITPDGRVIFPRGPKGVPTYPNIQFWDYTQRSLSDAAKALEREHPDQAGALKGILSDLKAELDKLVPEFQLARRGASNFFKAEDASEAGRKFVMMNADPREARRALAAMNPAERELFARGFADELAQTVLKAANTMGTIKRAFTSPLAREKIETAIGATRARELEALLRAEVVAERTKDALGNSTTARQQQMIQALKTGTHNVAGAGAVGAFEFFKDQEHDIKSIAVAALIGGLLRHGAHVGAHKVDTTVYRKIGEMLASEDPTILRKGVQAVARSPQLFNALRNGTEVGARVTAHDVGGNNALAAAATLLERVWADEEGGEHHAHDNQNPTPDLLQ